MSSRCAIVIAITLSAIGASATPPEDRQYTFDISNGSYAQMIDAFARQADRGVVGTPPRGGNVELCTDEPLAFDEALSQVRLLLFYYKPTDPYWLLWHGEHFEVIRVNDLLRMLPDDRMFRSLDAFRAASMPPDEIALVVMTPGADAVLQMDIVRNFLPDYVRVARLPDQNALTLFGLASDIEKCVELIDLFSVPADDPRALEVIEIRHILPSTALDALSMLMDLEGDKVGTPRRRARGRRSAGARASRARRRRAGVPTVLVEPAPVLLPDDLRSVLIVRAMQDTIDEIRLLLPYIDVEKAGPGQMTIVDLEYADPEAVVGSLGYILADSPTRPATTASSKTRRTKRGRAKSRSRRRRSEPPVAPGGISAIPHPTDNAILVFCQRADLDRVVQLVDVLDVDFESEAVRIDLEYALPSETAATLTALLTGGRSSRGQWNEVEIVADPFSRAIWVTGRDSDVATVRELVATMDSETVQKPLHVIALDHHAASLVADLLRQYDDGQHRAGAGQSSSRRRRPRRRPDPGVSTGATAFIPDDEAGRLYALCTDEEWAEYVSIIEQLEHYGEREDLFVRLELRHLSPADAIAQLEQADAVTEHRAARIGYLPVDEGILVTGAQPLEIEDIEALLGELDVPPETERRRFELLHLSPAEVVPAIDALYGASESTQRKRRRGRSRSRRRGTVDALNASDLTVVPVGNELVVETAPETMQQIAELIDELDVAEQASELRVYEEFAPGTDLAGIVETLIEVVGGTTDHRSWAKKNQSGRVTGPLYLPKPEIGQLLVYAQPPIFLRIEQVLDAIEQPEPVDDIEVAFYDLEYADPASVVESIAPVLELEVAHLVAAGELEAMPTSAPTPRKRTSRAHETPAVHGRYCHVAPDPDRGRVIVSGPQVVIDAAFELIEQLDRPAEETAVAFRVVRLVHADTDSIMASIHELLDVNVRAARHRSRKRRTRPAGTDTDALSINPAPGDGALILQGYPESIRKAAKWIERLDALSASARSVRIYQIEHADVENLGAFLMNVVEPVTRSPRRRVRNRRVRQPVIEEDVAGTSRTWTRGDVYMHADVVERVLTVAADKSTMAEIDDLVARLDTVEVSGALNDTPLPVMVYEVEHVDVLDAAFDLETVLGALWQPSRPLPTVEVGTFDDVLVIRYPDERRFPEIEQLITEYVDKPDPGGKRQVRRTVRAPRGMTAKETVMWLKKQHPEVDIRIREAPSRGKDSDYGLERVTPRHRVDE